MPNNYELADVFKISQMRVNDQLVPFKSTTSPRSFINLMDIFLIFTGPKYLRFWFCKVPPNSI